MSDKDFSAFSFDLTLSIFLFLILLANISNGEIMWSIVFGASNVLMFPLTYSSYQIYKSAVLTGRSKE